MIDLSDNYISEAQEQALDQKSALVHEVLRLRRSKRLTQKNIEAVSGVKQPVVARLERDLTDPQLTTLLKVLAPLGKTLAIVPMDKNTSGR